MTYFKNTVQQTEMYEDDDFITLTDEPYTYVPPRRAIREEDIYYEPNRRKKEKGYGDMCFTD